MPKQSLHLQQVTSPTRATDDQLLRGMVTFYAGLFRIDDALERAQARIAHH